MSLNQAANPGRTLLKQNFGVIFGTGVVSYVFIFGLLFGVGQVWKTFRSDTAQPFDAVAAWHSYPVTLKIGILLVFVLCAWLPQLMTHAGAAWTARAVLRHEDITLVATGKAVFGRLPQLLLLALAIGVPSFIGGLMFVVPGLLVAALGVTVVPQMFIGELRLWPAIRSGMGLSGRRFGKLFLLVLVAVGAGVVVSLVLTSLVVFSFDYLPAILAGAAAILALSLSGSLVSSWLGAMVSALCICDDGVAVPPLANVASTGK